MRRGLTMLELLVAVGLLSALLLATASWTRVAARSSTSTAEPMRWRVAAEAVLSLIHDDLATGDFANVGRRGRNQAPRVEVTYGTLRINTRSVAPGDVIGSVTNRYTLDSFSGELQLDQRTRLGRRSARLLLDGVSKWKCELDEEKDILTISIVSNDATGVGRSYLLHE